MSAVWRLGSEQKLIQLISIDTGVAWLRSNTLRAPWLEYFAFDLVRSENIGPVLRCERFPTGGAVACPGGIILCANHTLYRMDVTGIRWQKEVERGTEISAGRGNVRLHTPEGDLVGVIDFDGEPLEEYDPLPRFVLETPFATVHLRHRAPCGWIADVKLKNQRFDVALSGSRPDIVADDSCVVVWDIHHILWITAAEAQLWRVPLCAGLGVWDGIPLYCDGKCLRVLSRDACTPLPLWPNGERLVEAMKARGRDTADVEDFSTRWLADEEFRTALTERGFEWFADARHSPYDPSLLYFGHDGAGGQFAITAYPLDPRTSVVWRAPGARAFHWVADSIAAFTDGLLRQEQAIFEPPDWFRMSHIDAACDRVEVYMDDDVVRQERRTVRLGRPTIHQWMKLGWLPPGPRMRDISFPACRERFRCTLETVERSAGLPIGTWSSMAARLDRKIMEGLFARRARLVPGSTSRGPGVFGPLFSGFWAVTTPWSPLQWVVHIGWFRMVWVDELEVVLSGLPESLDARNPPPEPLLSRFEGPVRPEHAHETEMFRRWLNRRTATASEIRALRAFYADLGWAHAVEQIVDPADTPDETWLDVYRTTPPRHPRIVDRRRGTRVQG